MWQSHRIRNAALEVLEGVWSPQCDACKRLTQGFWYPRGRTFEAGMLEYVSAHCVLAAYTRVLLHVRRRTHRHFQLANWSWSLFILPKGFSSQGEYEWIGVQGNH